MRMFEWKSLMSTTVLFLLVSSSSSSVHTTSREQVESDLTSKTTMGLTGGVLGQLFKNTLTCKTQPATSLDNDGIGLTFDGLDLGSLGSLLPPVFVALELQFLAVYNVLATTSCTDGVRLLNNVTFALDTRRERGRSLATTKITATVKGTCRGCSSGSTLFNVGIKRGRKLEVADGGMQENEADKEMHDQFDIETKGIRGARESSDDRTLKQSCKPCLGPAIDKFISSYNKALAKLLKNGIINVSLSLTALTEN